MSFRAIATTLSLLGAASYVYAFAEEGGGPCDTVGEACSWQSFNSAGNIVTFNGFCAPDLFCGDNGASCTTDDNCYDFCGAGICGGEGSTCTSTVPFAHNQEEIACFTPGFTCTTDDPNVSGTCVAAPTGGSTKTRHRRMQQRNMKRALEQCDGPTEALCGLSSVDGQNGVFGFECVDVQSNLERCGGCVTDGVGQDCTLVPGALDVECLVGACAISSCLPGYAFFEGTCTEI